MENQKKKSFLFFKREDKPDLLPEDTTPTLQYFFKLLWRKAGKLLTLNLMMIPQVALLLIAFFIYFLGPKVPTVESALHAPLLGISIAGGSPTANLIMGQFTAPLGMPYLTPVRTAIIVALVAVTVLTWGWQNVGATYNMRSLVRGDSCFLWSDYFYAIRKNLRQGFVFGLIDAIIIIVLGVDLFYFNALSGEGFWFGAMFIMSIALSIIYGVMRVYVYYMMITFDLSIKKLLKNALIFVPLGIKRNIMALLGVIVVFGINLLLIVPSLSINLSIVLVLPIFYIPALINFIWGYALWPIIQRYMIDPYNDPNAKDEDKPEEAEAKTEELEALSEETVDTDAKTEVTPAPIAD